MDERFPVCPWLSDAEIIERARFKVRHGKYSLGPQARDGIALSKKAKRQRIATSGPDLDYRTTVEEDLLNVIATGSATEVTPLTILVDY